MDIGRTGLSYSPSHLKLPAVTTNGTTETTFEKQLGSVNWGVFPSQSYSINTLFLSLCLKENELIGLLFFSTVL